MTSRLLILALILALAVPLAACGRKNPPEPPAGSEAPHKYPARKS